MNVEKILDDYVAPALPAALDTVAAIGLEGVAGAVVPGVGNMLLAYQQKQQEKRFQQAIDEIHARQDEIDNILKDYKDELEPVIAKLTEIYIEYNLANSQEKKVPYLCNGYVNSIKVETPQEDVILGFYDTMAQVNELDIRIMRLYVQSIVDSVGDNYIQIMDDYGIEYSQYHMIQMKLERLGLIESKNDIKQEENLEYIIDYLLALNKNNANNAKRALGKIRKPSKSKSYKITTYGRNFMKFFCNL